MCKLFVLFCGCISMGSSGCPPICKPPGLFPKWCVYGHVSSCPSDTQPLKLAFLFYTEKCFCRTLVFTYIKSMFLLIDESHFSSCPHCHHFVWVIPLWVYEQVPHHDFKFYFLMMQNIFQVLICSLQILIGEAYLHVSFLACVLHIHVVYIFIYIIHNMVMSEANWGFPHSQRLRGPLLHSRGESQRASPGLFSV